MLTFNGPKTIMMALALAASSFNALEAAEKKADKEITLKKIMSNPDWMGVTPTRWNWSPDGNSIIYTQRQAAGVVMDQFTDGITSADKPALIPHKNRLKFTGLNGPYNTDRSKQLFTHKGNLFVRKMADGTIKQLTRSSKSVRSPMFLTDGRIAFMQDGRVMVMDGMVTEVAYVKAGKKPNRSVKDPKGYIAKEQHKLIEYIQSEHDKRKAREKEIKKADAADDSLTAKPFYVGAGYRPLIQRLSPNGTKLFVVASTKREERKKSDIMPHYIQPDASIKAVPARQRVGTFKFEKHKFLIIDLKTRKITTLKVKDLAGFDEDVLASVKAENYKRDGKTYKSKKKKRVIHHRRSAWSQDGSQLAIMMRAMDHKDRWITTVDFNKGKFITHERYHDDAWVNSYAFSQMGWAGDNKTLYYQSEKDGYGHIYARDVVRKKTRQLTKGTYIAERLTLGPKGEKLYYIANKDHPGSYNVYRVDVKSGNDEQLSSLGGRQNFRLSPDGSKLLIEQSEMTRPPELFVQDASEMAKATQISEFTSKEFLSYNWQKPEVIEVPASTHKRPIYSRIYRPDPDKTGNKTGDKKRAVMFIHGAGYLQNAHKGWSGYFREFMFHQMLAQKGYVVMDMDWRASKGYGRDWRTAIYRNMGTPEVQDIRDGVNWMIKHENVDPKRIGGYGGSYGGFLTLMAMFKEPDLFAAGSALRLVSDWTSYNQWYTSAILNTPKDDPIAFERSSPIYFAEGLQKPLLINAPMVDSNVFFQDTVRLVQRLIELEKTDNFETAIFPVENHGFTEPSSWLDEYRRIFKLFEENL